MTPARGRDREREDQRPKAGWGTEAWAIKRKMMGGEKMVERAVGAETDTEVKGREADGGRVSAGFKEVDGREARESERWTELA